MGGTVPPMANDDVFDYNTSTGDSAPRNITAEVYASDGSTTLERLRNAVSQKIERSPQYLEVPERPGVEIEISPNITQEQMKSWRKNSGENSRNGFDSIKFACYIIASCTRGIRIDGEEVLTEDGSAVSFASPEIMEMTGTTRPVPDCVRAFFGIDPHIESAAVAIMDAAGWGDEVDTVDPTKTSSTNS